ncbi:MAG: Hemolysin erythrocyte lysis protein 2 [uncultured bacterium]|nr:MAG: Hemolysin erythrocyte lysis protein 2 [uncultured bacterium]
MQAVLLASGSGNRLLPLTQDRPKCLVAVNGKPLLQGIVEALTAHGIQDLIVTTGPFPDQLALFFETHTPSLHPTFVANPDYATTNAITSLWLTREKITEDVLILHSDLLFDSSVLKPLLACEGSGVLIHPTFLSLKDFQAHVVQDRVMKIGVRLAETHRHFLFPIYKLKFEDWLIWKDAIERFIENGERNVYAEDAFNTIADQFVLNAVYYDGFAMEVDDLEDYEKARAFLP